jgi:hypothetical protein
MAGAGYKLFATGDVLTAAQVNTYLMEQTVMRFADSAARTTALSGVLAEGMVSYLQDTNTLEVYDGAAWVGATGDITGLTAGTGISISSATGPVPTVTNSMATEITAKGDLIVGTGSGTFDNLPVAENGSTIVADSSTSTGLRYTAGNAQGNPILNSAMQIWQRGTSIATPTSQYTADRWYAAGNSAVTVTRQTTNDSTNLPFIQYCARVQRNSGSAVVDNVNFLQSFENINSIPFAGKTVTMSFYARKGANYSSASSGLRFLVNTGTGTDQNAYFGYTGSAAPIDQTVTLTTTWQRFSYSGTIATGATELAPYFLYTPVGTAGAADYFEVTGVQIDIGSVALPFRTYAGTLQGELAACQRYYYRTTVQAGQHFANGLAQDTTTAIYVMPYPVTMRIAPTALEQSGTATDYSVRTGVTNTTCSGVPLFGNASTQNAIFSFTVASGLVASTALFARPAVNGAYLGWSAEL